MATISVNPERRDPGYLRKKADIGLSNVDNISATDFINTVADDVKIIGNRKILTTKFSGRQGEECYFGILKTSDTGLSAHVNFSTGLFKDDVLDKELAQFNVDFSYSTETSSSTGTLGYSIQVPDSDPYLSNLEIIFTQVGAILYVILYTKSFPVKNTSNYFNQVGTDITEWTEGVCLIGDTSDELSKLVKSGKELARLKLDSSHTTIQSEYCESLPVYNKEDGSRVLIEPKNYSSAELEELDYPTINGVPFIARKGMKINNQEENNARNITVSAKHPGSTREEAGGHDWEVLDNFLATYYKTVLGPLAFGKPRTIRHRPMTHTIQNDDSELSSGYGLCKLAGYTDITASTAENYDDASEKALKWLGTLGSNDSDVITVGLFKNFMNFMFNYVFPSMTSSSDESTVVSYSAWNINIKADTSTVSHEGENRDIWISASRIKTIATYNSDGEEINSTSETEVADISQISVSISSGDDGNVYSPETDSDKWEFEIPENTTSYEKTYHLLVYVDYGESSEKFETITYTQEAYEDEVVNVSYNVGIFNTITTVAASENTQDIYYLIQVEKIYSSGKTSTEYYNGEDVKITVPGATVKFIQNGKYQVTYPANIDATQKVYSVTLKYETIEQSLTVGQSPASEEDTIVGFGYVFNADPQQVVFEAIGGEKMILTSSYSCEIHSISDPTKVEELAYTVTSKPSWISIDNDSSDFIYNLYISAEYNNLGGGRQGEIVLTQNTSGNTITLAVSQKATITTVVSNVWKVYTLNIDTSTVKLTGETREYNISYINVITYSNGLESIFYYSGEDISVEVKTIKGDKTATAEYDNGWKIIFPESTTENTYQVTATYQGIESDTRTIYQGKSKTKTGYVFEINKVEATNAVGSLVGSYDSDTKIISFPNLSGKVKVYFNSYTIDYFDNGTSVSNTSDFIPFVYYYGTGYISSISRDSNILILDIPENTSSQRTNSIQVTQNISGKALTFYVTQEISTIEYSIKIESVKYGNSENYVLPDFSNGQESVSSQSVALKPVKTVNGTDTEMPGSEISVSEDINWLETSYNSSTGLLSMNATTNNSGSTRKGTIYLVYKNGSVNVSMSVSQKAGSSYITIDESTGTSMYTVSKSKEAQIVSLNVESNYPYVISGSASWVSIMDGISKSAGSSIITFDLEQNNYSSNRSCDFTLTSEGGTTRIIRVTQLSRTNYIDVVGFEGNDIIVTTSSWKKQISIPIKAAQQIFIDYYSDWLKTGFYASSKTDNTYYDDVSKFNPLVITGYTDYLFISSVNPSATNTGGVVSLSYYDSASGTIVCGRKIFVNNLPNANVLPYGSRDIFVSGDTNTIDLYAYVKSGVTDLSSYSKKKSAIDTSDGYWTTDNPDTKELASVSVNIPENTETVYRDIYYTLYSKNAGDTDTLAETLPEFRVHQYPRKYLGCYIIDENMHSTQSINVSSEGEEELAIYGSANCSSGYWEFYGNSIPGWISVLDDISVQNNEDSDSSFNIRIEPNFDTESRSTQLQFWCDSDYNTINTITITQSGSTTKASRNAEYDFSLVTATSKTNYLYLYGVTSTYVAKTIGSDGKSENINTINTTITTVNSNTLRIEYSIGTENKYYYKDIYKVLNLTCEDGVIRQLFIKNPRTQDVTIEISRDRLNYSSGYTNAIDNFVLSSNIGLTGFYQGTYYDLEKSSVDFTTLEISSKASYNNYGNDYYNPEKIFYRQQIMDKLLLKNMDVIPGYTYEKSVMLPARTDTTLKNRGIGIYTSLDDSSIISNINSTETLTYSMNLPSNQKDSSGTQLYTIWYFKAYDGVTISTSKSGDGFNLITYQPESAKKAGSLGKIMLSVSALSDNTETSSKYLGSITLSITNGTQRIIHIYQSANAVDLVGKAGLNAVKENSSDYSEKWTSTEANLIYRSLDSSWNLTFVHEYSNWMFIDLLGNSGFTFNGKSYSGTFGEGGNSGTATSALSSKIDGCSYKSTVLLTPPKLGISILNDTLEMIESGRYGLISTYGTNNITDKSNVKSTIHVYTRPDRPGFTVYNTSGVKVIDSGGENGSGKILSLGVINSSGIKTRSYTVSFRLMSNYINRCKDYIGKTIKLNGQNVKIETKYDLFLKLIDSINIKYKGSSGVETIRTVALSSYTTGESDGNPYIQFVATISMLTTDAISSGDLNITLNDFVIDSSLYYAMTPLSVSVPIYFNTSDLVTKDDDSLIIN